MFCIALWCWLDVTFPLDLMSACSVGTTASYEDIKEGSWPARSFCDSSKAEAMAYRRALKDRNRPTQHALHAPRRPQQRRLQDPQLRNTRAAS
ncbi:hypothetical protein H920_04635 [Fukomys damarensis]|uniref:Secreted protein n=1 Tax=Fukomys damarensis TaxID=885580 RepID=A0A091DPC2_FUKDA|nr:hypothetical protein H920_04635 [Fukomys damarensis]